jgi:flagellar motor switch/type III secretory pathway protein FliN
MGARPFVLVGSSRLQEALARLGEAIREWRCAWGLAREDMQLTCVSASAEAVLVAGWCAWRPSPDVCAWVRFEDRFDECLCAALFASAEAWERPAHASASIAAEVAQAARDDLVAGLVAALRGRPIEAVDRLDLDAPTDDLARRGSGAVVARCELAGAVLHVLMANEELAPRAARGELRAPREALPDPHAAVQRVPITLSVEVGTVEIDLGTLRHLVPGDVLRLGTSLESPLAVMAPDDTILCRGHLGAHRGSRAIDLIP